MNIEAQNNGAIIFRMARNSGNPYEYICSFTPAIYWLNEVYKDLVRENLITHFRSLGQDKKLLYWTAICLTIPDKPKWLKVIACFACYIFDEMNIPAIE
jgi:hypothetical protein